VERCFNISVRGVAGSEIVVRICDKAQSDEWGYVWEGVAPSRPWIFFTFVDKMVHFIVHLHQAFVCFSHTNSNPLTCSVVIWGSSSQLNFIAKHW